jgi:hypothetical protein
MSAGSVPADNTTSPFVAFASIDYIIGIINDRKYIIARSYVRHPSWRKNKNTVRKGRVVPYYAACIVDR